MDDINRPPLSPVAWQVASAASVAKDHGKSPIAATLRAAAYQVAPARPELDSCCEHWEQSIRHKILAIAAELEGHDG